MKNPWNTPKKSSVVRAFDHSLSNIATRPLALAKQSLVHIPSLFGAPMVHRSSGGSKPKGGK
jgi:hypothetical protein